MKTSRTIFLEAIATENAPISQRAQAVLHEALALPPDDRAKVAAGLLASLDTEAIEDPAEVEAAWAAEIEKRARRVMAGESVGVRWEDVRARANSGLSSPRRASAASAE